MNAEKPRSAPAPSPPPSSSDLKPTLDDCVTYAKRGCQLAANNLREMKAVLEQAKEEVRQCSARLNKNQLDVASVRTSLQAQLLEIRESFDILSNELQNDLVDKEERLSLFSVTLFGRTMAGKSTLMEILRYGDGASIGKGVQRTTRDVRSYTWNGLEITDVPGIAAFEGEEDEQIAFASARQADLVLFLLTDDAPQAAEAQCLAKIRNLGKPVLCIMNVKASIDPERMKLSLRDLTESFDPDRLGSIQRQFLQFSWNYGQDWSDIPFIFTHLHAAFLSRRPSCEQYAAELWRHSRFSLVEQSLIHEVRTRGRFLRVKTFVDAASKPSVDVFHMLVEQSVANSLGGRTVISKRKKLVKWREAFSQEGSQRITYFCDKLRAQLEGEIPAFVEDHFDRPDAGTAWEALVRGMRIEDSCERLFQELADECDTELRELAREIESELSFSSMKFSANRSIKMSLKPDGRRISRWGLSIASGVLTIGGLLTGTLSGPVGWAAAALGLASIIFPKFFPEREKTVGAAKRHLDAALREDIGRIVEPIQHQLLTLLRKDLLESCVDRAAKNIDAAVDTIFTLSQTQRNLAATLNRQLKSVNGELLREALEQVGAAGLDRHFQDTARLPGEYMLIEVGLETVIPRDVVVKLEKLLQEKVLFVRYAGEEQQRTLVGRVMRQGVKDFDWRTVTVEEKPKIVHVPVDRLTPYGLNLKDLAQQLTDYLITE